MNAPLYLGPQPVVFSLALFRVLRELEREIAEAVRLEFCRVDPPCDVEIIYDESGCTSGAGAGRRR